MAGERLRVTGGKASGTEISFEDEFLIGRATTGEGRLGEDPELSRNHARIARRAGDQLTIEDLGSTNGTFVNGKRITEAQTLRPGDTVKLGTTTLQVLDETGAAPQATALGAVPPQAQPTAAAATPPPAPPPAAPPPAAAPPRAPGPPPAPAPRAPGAAPGPPLRAPGAAPARQDPRRHRHRRHRPPRHPRAGAREAFPSRSSRCSDCCSSAQWWQESCCSPAAATMRARSPRSLPPARSPRPTTRPPSASTPRARASTATVTRSW